MDYSDFIGRVQNRAKMGTEEDAVQATRVTLETLSERLAKAEADDLAAQLPEEIGRFMEIDKESERFSVDEFFKRISEKSNVKIQDAAYHARVVIEVLSEAVSEGELDDVRNQLPDDYNPLFEAGSTGEM